MSLVTRKEFLYLQIYEMKNMNGETRWSNISSLPASIYTVDAVNKK